MKKPSDIGYIYLLTFNNGKQYVGLTKDFKNRMRQHLERAASKKSKLYDGWRKHGLTRAEVLFMCPVSYLPEYEVYFIDEYGTYRHGYNSTPGGEISPLNYAHIREAHLASVRATHADPAYVERHREGIRRANSNLKYVTARDLRLAAMNSDPEFAISRDERLRALHVDPSFVAARSEGIRRKSFDPAYRAARIAGVKRKNAEPEFAAARNARMSAMNSDPAFIEARAKRNADPNHRQLCNMGIALYWAVRNGIPHTSLWPIQGNKNAK